MLRIGLRLQSPDWYERMSCVPAKPLLSARRLLASILSAFLVAVVLPVLQPAAAASSELVEDTGVELVRGHCSACHGLELVTSQRGDRQFWLDTIRWMQNTQNLWQIPAAQENLVLDYLATNYNETEWGRRPPLPYSQLPGVSTD